MATELRESPPGDLGLSSSEVRARVARGEINTIQESPSRTTAEIIRANVVTRFNILLGALLVVILVAVREPRDALFGIVLVTNAAIGIVQELRAKATLDRLAVLTSPTVFVLRDGEPRQLGIDQIVVDDVIELRSGDQLPVDGTVVSSRGLEIDESLLTGEADPVAKDVGDECLSGSFVAAGTGRYRATKVGEQAYAATLAREAKRFTLVRSELRDGIDFILAGVSWAVVPVIALLVWSQLRLDNNFIEALRSAVAGAVGMVPQGLVLLTSIAFAVGVIRLGRRQVLVQELPAIEGLARVDTVCFDKTGTLTHGKLSVQGLETLADDPDAATALGAIGAAEPDPNATLAAVARHFPAPSGWRVSHSVPFSSARKWSGATFEGRGSWLLGAPEILAPDDRVVADAVQEHAWRGLRVLLLARSDGTIGAEALPRVVRPVAIVALGDQIRAEASDTLRYFAQQNVKAKVISGDHPDTVAAIARQVGVPGANNVVDARELPEDTARLAEVMEHNSVFGRVTPQQKRGMVTAMQSKGHVVAMTGDGVNDVLALKDADIGIAVGAGSAASRAVAQLVLVDSSFATLPGVVGEGRRVISNIERVANLFVTKTVYAIFIAVVIGLIGRPFPFLPRHLTLVGSVTIGIPAFFLALAPSARRARPGFVLRVLRFALPVGLAAGLASFAAYELAIAEDVDLIEARTMATLVLAALGLFALGIVSRPLVTWKRGLIASMAALLLLLMVLPGSQDFFELEMPRPVVLMAAVGITSITGAAMIGTLRGIGWIRQMPEYLRQHPPEPSRTWANMRASLSEVFGAAEPAPPLPEPEAEPSPRMEAAAAEPRTAAADQEVADQGVADLAEQVREDPLGEIEWFDPDTFDEEQEQQL